MDETLGKRKRAALGEDELDADTIQKLLDEAPQV
jgi:hypothetical protein